MKKFLILMAVSAFFAACGQETAPPADTQGTAPAAQQGAETPNVPAGDAEAVPFNFLIPGNEPQEVDLVLEIINQRLAEDEVGIALSLTYIPWDAWDHRLNIMLSTGEEFDMFHVMNDRVSLSNYAARGALADISEYMERYGENIRQVVPPMVMASGQVGGVQYAIPTFWLESALNPEITLRRDILEEFGLEVPTSFEALTDAFVYVMENWDRPQQPFLPLVGAGASTFGVAQKTYDNWPFHVYDSVFYVNQDGTIANWFETEAFRQDAQNARLWFELGLINPDVLMFTNDMIANQLISGNWFVHFGTIGNIEPLRNEFPDITVDDFIWLDFTPERPRLRPYGARNMNAVPLTSQNPESAVKFVNWLYANQDNYDLFLYGREGIDFIALPPHNREAIINPIINEELYFFADWMIGNLAFIRPGTTAPAVTNEALFVRNENAIDGIAAMFTFDASPVQTQMVDVQTQISAVIAPIITGVRDYDSYIDDALTLLRAAGVDDLVEAFRTQFNNSR